MLAVHFRRRARRGERVRPKIALAPRYSAARAPFARAFGGRKRSFAFARNLFIGIGRFCEFALAPPRLIRLVGPGYRPLERHEFEGRGGCGGIGLP